MMDGKRNDGSNVSVGCPVLLSVSCVHGMDGLGFREQSFGRNIRLDGISCAHT